MAGTILQVADLANNIAAATSGLATAFGLANPEPNFKQYEELGITSKFQRENWYKNPSQGLYSFSVEAVNSNESAWNEFASAGIGSIKSAFDQFFGGDDHFGEFNLPITPQEITQTEDFAVTMKPTQGGTVVNHSGNKYKTLTVSGTTGVQPNRGLLGVFKGTGLAIGKPDSLQYRSGYEVFQHFRNWMRSYHQIKSEPGQEKLRMLFRNYKDWEFLYVEPIKFTMKRDANKPLLYNYFIQFKVLGNKVVDKPLFDLVVSKLNEVGAALVNTYALIKKNKSVTESITGVITDFEQSLNNLKLAVKAANKTDVKASEFTSSDAKKLSFKETLQMLGAIGNAMVKASTDTKAAEQSNTYALNDDPFNKGQDLIKKSKNPSIISADSAKAELNSLLESEPALCTGVKLDLLPPAIKSSLGQKQIEAALISRVKVSEIQVAAKDVQDKLAEGVGLGDDTYNQIFGITPTNIAITQSEVTDDQFEMMYALSQTINNIDGILASDTLFDTNSALFQQSTSTNGANSIGQGVFSFPDPTSGTKEGFLSSGLTLEDIALSELGDASRWTEIAELNGLKAPYISTSALLPSPGYTVMSANYTNPTQIKDLQITYLFLIPGIPTPTGAWSGKGDYIAEYMGGDKTDSSNWRFIYPDEGLLVSVTSTGEFFQFSNGEWLFVASNDVAIDGVLRPGDKIKIPSNSKPSPALTLQGPRDNRWTNNLSNSEKILGVDLKLNSQMDIDFTPSGDLGVTVGVENAAQAIVLKLLYTKGSLKKFPTIGTNLTPGRKMPDIAAIRSDVTASLLQDNRIKNVTKINLIQENGTISLFFEVIFVGVQQPIPITIPI